MIFICNFNKKIKKMTKEALREDKTCLNCGGKVEKRFCPQCGQENTETRKSFHHLFTHFIEDLVHYDSGFWKTMKYLLFYPAKLTKEYLSGRRQSFVLPVKLYIFVSFITFFLSGFVLNPDDLNFKEKNSALKVKPRFENENLTSSSDKDTLSNSNTFFKKNTYGWISNYKTIRQLDSVQNSLPAKQKMSKLEYWLKKKVVNIAEHNTIQEASEKSILLFKQNLPKVLFLYMPMFAFWLWLFHGKKRWYYFDHGIFTLHYFSFLLLLTSLLIISEWIFNYFDNLFIDILLGLTRTAYILWPIIYFYKAHKTFYEERTFTSFVKSSILFIINNICLFVIMMVYLIYVFISIH